MGSSGGGGGTQTNITRFAPYLESRHQAHLSTVNSYVNSLRNNSPFSSFSDIDIDEAFLGTGITITSFSSVFSIFEDFMKDVDIDKLYTASIDTTLSNEAIKNSVLAEGKLLSDDIETDALPRLMAGARDINAVNSSTFIIAKSNIENKRIKMLSKFSTNLKTSLLPLAHDRWTTTLNWKKQIAYTYMELMKLYFSGKFDEQDFNYKMKTKNSLWPFTVMEHERVALGTFSGAQNRSTIAGEGPSTGQKVIGGALSGAAAGAMVGSVVPGIGTAVGAAVGAIVGGIGGAM